MERHDRDHAARKHKLGVVSGVYVPVCLSILSILMFLRFGAILGEIGLLGMLGLLILSYLVDFVTALSLSAVASNGEVKGGGTYYLISRSLGPEFGGSIGLLFYLSQALNTALNVVGLVDCLYLSFGRHYQLPGGYWAGYCAQTVALALCGLLCLAGSALFAKASNGLLVILTVATLSIPLSAVFRQPFADPSRGVEFTGVRLTTLRANLLPHAGDGHPFRGLATFRDLFGILFPATSGIFAGASMSGDLRNPSKSIPGGTLAALGSTLAVYVVVILSMAASTTHGSLLTQPNIVQETSIWPPLILAGECAVTFFSALMGLIGASRLLQALGRDHLLPGLASLAWGTPKNDEPLVALVLTYAIAQLALFADLNQIATFISMGYMVTFFVMNLACFLLKIGSAPNFRPAFKFFSWQTALFGSVMSAAAMFFIDETYATSSVVMLVVLFLLIHYLCPPKRWGDVSQNLIYHQVRKYLLRLKPEHIKFWRPQIILLTNDPRRQTRLIRFCNSMKKGGLYVLGHVIVTDDFNTGVLEAKLQQTMWSQYITEYSRIKAFVQLTMSPTITWGVRNLILSSGLGGMRPNIAVLGFYNMDELRTSRPLLRIPGTPLTAPASPASPSFPPSSYEPHASAEAVKGVHMSSSSSSQPLLPRRRRGDTSSRLLEGALPTDVIKKEGMMKVTEYLTILEDLALRHRINVAVAKGFHNLETPHLDTDGDGTKKYIDLWPIQMSAELEADGKSVLTTNFDTYTLILQLGYILHSVPTWKRVYNLRVMVFVEYESEVKEERQRVEALLDKLRISAEVHVFWLAQGDLATYEAIVQGTSDSATERLVDEVLANSPWWQTVQGIRGQASDLADKNPSWSAAGTAGPSSPSSAAVAKRRASLAHIDELPRHQTVSALARLGLSMGIRTQRLGGGPVSLRSRYDGDNDGDSSSIGGADVESSSEDDNFDPDFNDLESAVSYGGDVDVDDADERRPLIFFPPLRKKGVGIAPKTSKRPSLSRTKTPDEPLLARQPIARSGYGTMFADVSLATEPSSSTDDQAGTSGSAVPAFHSSQSMLSLSSSMRFSSSIVPETRITSPEESERTIMFAEAAASGRPERPPFSRTNSRQSRISMADSVTTKKRSKASRPSVSFVEPDKEAVLRQQEQQQSQKLHRPQFSRHMSTPVVQQSSSVSSHSFDGSGSIASTGSGGAGEVRLGIARLVDEYKAHRRGDGSSGDSHVMSNESSGNSKIGTGNAVDDGASASGSSSGGSSYATQDMALSFNDLPSRAQHLILNELMRLHSGGAAVLFTTLPIPEEGTSRDEAASLQYLADVELLCQDLPPVLMILSNTMTVTVSL